ncbi:MAG TPA: hypothetical protein DEF82_09290 [Crocinitomicaceae bacterium]|nr:hypothetical protein [Flavobacteriales bacterium]HBW86913.1 hypothetical protein [Crocinitomicaceae bacterium]
MRSIVLLSFYITTSLIFNSCIKPEVIPPPTTTVDLNCSFSGFINGTNTEITQNVLGYNAYGSNEAIPFPSPQLSRRLYYSEIKSAVQSQSIKLSLGSQLWDASVSTIPSLTMFNDFHSVNANMNIPFKDYSTLISSNPASLGMNIEYRDNNNVLWKSKETDPGQSGVYTILKQASDNSGDYSLFECSFSCLVWKFDETTQSFVNPGVSIPITNAKFKGWFLR